MELLAKQPPSCLLGLRNKEHTIVTAQKEIPYSVPGQRLSSISGRAVDYAVSRWVPTAAARVRVRAACGAYGGQSGTRAGFLRIHRFPLPIIPPISPLS
jgi:hypothetical protein